MQFASTLLIQAEIYMGRKNPEKESAEAWRLFEAEAAYAESIFRGAIGDMEASIAAAERALEIKPDYPPAVLTMGSIEYQREKSGEGALPFAKLLSLPDCGFWLK